MSQAEAENLMRAMAREFGGDPAATDSTRVLRLPGFYNKKYRGAVPNRGAPGKLAGLPLGRFQGLAGGDAGAGAGCLPAPRWPGLIPQEHPFRARLALGYAPASGRENQLTISSRNWSSRGRTSLIPGYYARLTVTRAYARYALSHGTDPQEVIRTISAHPPRATEDGEAYARKTVSETQRLINSQRPQAQAHAEPPQGTAQRLALRMTP